MLMEIIGTNKYIHQLDNGKIIIDNELKELLKQHVSNILFEYLYINGKISKTEFERLIISKKSQV